MWRIEIAEDVNLGILIPNAAAWLEIHTKQLSAVSKFRIPFAVSCCQLSTSCSTLESVHQLPDKLLEMMVSGFGSTTTAMLHEIRPSAQRRADYKGSRLTQHHLLKALSIWKANKKQLQDHGLDSETSSSPQHRFDEISLRRKSMQAAAFRHHRSCLAQRSALYHYTL